GKHLENFTLVLATLAFGFGLAGCYRGPALVSARGIVKYKNAPIPGADVVLVPDGDGQPAIGRTDDQGQFTLNTNGRKGALVGTYKVSITAARPKREVSQAEAVAMSIEPNP